MRKADNVATGGERVDQPPDTAKTKWVGLTGPEFATFTEMRKAALNAKKRHAPITVGGAQESRTFSLGTDPRIRVRSDKTEYTRPAGGQLRITLTAIDDDGNVLTGFRKDVDLWFRAGSFSNAPRLLRFSFAAGVATRQVALPDSGAFEIDESTGRKRGYRFEDKVLLYVWE